MNEDNVQDVQITNMMPLNVKINRIDIPFKDIFWLTFKALFASLLVSIILFSIPLGYIALVNDNQANPPSFTTQ